MGSAVVIPAEGSAVVLPPNYIAARIAIAKCDRVDECQDWANRSSALASYAQQSKDDALLLMAQRIRARAVRRCGELLNEIPAVPPTHTRKAEGQATRTSVATAAGMSEHQKNRALQVARVAEKQFDELVESDAPPGISTLARIGQKPRNLGRRFGIAAKRVKRFARWCEDNEPKSLRVVASKDDVRAIATWCKEFLT